MVRAQHKLTEAGEIPEDWKVLPISSVGGFSKGQGIRKDQAQSGSLPCIRYGELYTHHHDIVRDFSSFISSEVAQTSKRIKKGDVLFAGSGETKEEIGKCAVYISEGVAYAGGDIVVLSPKVGNSKFLGYLFNAPYVSRCKASLGQGDAVVHISSTSLGRIIIPFPPEKEQKAIAEALSDADALIESLEKLIAKKRLIKQGAMQQLLTGRKRLPGFRKEWTTVLLGQIAKIQTGSRNNEDKVEDGVYPFFVRSPNVERINTYSYECEAILVPGEGNIGNIFHYVNGRFDLHQRVYGVRQFNESSCGKFIYYYMLKFFGPHALQNTVKATVDSLRLPTFENFSMCVPSDKDEQAAIAEALSEIDSELSALEQKLTKARQIKQGMMQELLTGRIRLI